jgi:catechol 2,3-dioxygenase-like lactoylglutathione lyase family enzyme
MKRFHVHLSVPDLGTSIRFYSGLFGSAPAVEKPDYAKWMLDEPRVNFAISQRGAKTGLNHLGLQADSAGELAEIRVRFEAAEQGNVVDEADAHCCYAVSDKHWVVDPQGIAWEAFHSLDTIPVYDGTSACGDGASGCCANVEADAIAAPASAAGSCCAKAPAAAPGIAIAAAPRPACCA